MPWYRAGTVSITAGQTTVTGTGTNFSLNARVGDAFQGPDGRWYEVANIASATVMGILPAYQGATVADGAYGLAPMQGYVKESADRLRQLVEQFGATLSLLGTPTDIAGLRQNIGAAARGTNSDITSLLGLTTALSVAQGGTGGNTQSAARIGLGLKSASIAEVVGAVSQSGGMPTGDLMERGSNASGEYEKYACGTLICRRVASSASGVGVSSPAGALYSSQQLGPDTFPHPFSGAPYVDGFVYSPGMIGWIAFADFASNNAWPKWAIFSPYSSQWSNLIVNFYAIGRWY